jgi:Uma2 family endonuclease
LVTVSVHKKHWTDKELLAFPKDGYEREVVNGELIVSPAGFDHGEIIPRILGRLYMFVADRNLGSVLDGQTGCRMKSGDLFSPDVSFVAKQRTALQRKKRKSFFEGAPDLVVEVLSPSDTVRVTEEKIAQYFENGTRLAWVVHPRSQSVYVYRHGPVADEVLSTADTLNGEKVVPGFSLAVARIFSE